MPKLSPIPIIVSLVALALLLTSTAVSAAPAEPGSSPEGWAGVSGSPGPAQLAPNACPQDSVDPNESNCAPIIRITKEFADPTATFQSGDDVQFLITVSKPTVGEADGFGSTTAAAANAAVFATVTVTDAATPNCDNDVGPLATGDSVSYNCTALNVTADFVNEACVLARTGTGQPFNSDPSTDCDQLAVVLEEPPTGAEGCTPGFWKQPQHFDSWEGFTPDQKFSDVFGVDPFTVNAGGRTTITDPTLLEALEATGGGINALARHAVAALLNAASSGVDFGLTQTEVITMTQDAIDSGDFEGTKDQFEEQNEQGCPLS